MKILKKVHRVEVVVVIDEVLVIFTDIRTKI